MKLSKLVSLVLAFAMVLTMFCGISLTASAETVTGYITCTSETYTDPNKDFSLALEDTSALAGMKYLYFYYKTTVGGNNIYVGLNDGDGTRVAPMNTQTTRGFATVSSTGTYKAKNSAVWGAGSGSIWPDGAFEGYVILDIANDMSIHGGYKGNDNSFDIATLKSISVWSSKAESYGNFGLAASKGDAVNAIFAKLGLGTSKDTYSSDIIPMNALEVKTTGGYTFDNYQSSNENLADAKWVGFRIKTGGAYAFTLDITANSTRYYSKTGNRSYKYLTADGNVADRTAENNNTYYHAAVDGWIILPIADFNMGTDVSAITKAYISPNTYSEEMLIGNFVVSTADTVDSLVEYYVGTEEEETPVEPEEPAITTIKSYTTFDSKVYQTVSTAEQKYSMNIFDMEDTSELADMKYFYFYYKTTAAGNSLNIALNDGDGTRWMPMTQSAAEGNQGFATVTTAGSYKSKNTSIWGNGSGGVFPNAAFEGYVILSIEDDMVLHNGYKGSDSAFDITTLKTIAVWNSKTESYGDFGFAASKGDAVNAILTKLGKGELNSTYSSEIIPANVEEFSTTGGKWFSNYQSSNANLANAKFIGFRLKTDSNYNFNIQLVETANSGTRFGLKNATRTYYTVSTDGTVNTNTAHNSAFTGSAFDGWVIFPLSDFVNGNTAINTASIVQAYMSPNADTVTIGNFAFSTADTPDSLAAYYTATATDTATAVAVNKIGGTINMLDDNSALAGKKWFGLKVTSENTADSILNWAMYVTSNTRITKPANTTYYLVAVDGTITTKTTTSYGKVVVPAGFDGYLVVTTDDLYSPWSVAEGITPVMEDYSSINTWKGSGEDNTGYTVSTPVFADTFAALYDEYTALAEDDYKDNTYLINKNSITIEANNSDLIGLTNLKADTTDAVNMQWFGFRIKTTGSNNYFKLYVYEEDVERYDDDGYPVLDKDGNILMQRECWWTNNTTYYLVTKAGKITEGKLDSNGQLWTGAAFDGYLIIPVSSFKQHTGNYLGNGALDLNEITSVKFNNSSFGLTAERFALAETRDELIEYLANAEMLYSYDNRGDVNGDKAVDVLDLIRYKKHAANIEVEMTTENMDVNGDEDIDFAVELTALRKLILNK